MISLSEDTEIMTNLELFCPCSSVACQSGSRISRACDAHKNKTNRKEYCEYCKEHDWLTRDSSMSSSELEKRNKPSLTSKDKLTTYLTD